MNIRTHTTKINRRSLFAAIPALAATTTVAHALEVAQAPVHDEPIIEWCEQWKSLRGHINETEGDPDTALLALQELEEKICTAKPASMAGAVAQLEHALDNFGEYVTGNVWKDLDNKLFNNLLGALKAGVA